MEPLLSALVALSLCVGFLVGVILLQCRVIREQRKCVNEQLDALIQPCAVCMKTAEHGCSRCKARDNQSKQLAMN